MPLCNESVDGFDHRLAACLDRVFLIPQCRVEVFHDAQLDGITGEMLSASMQTIAKTARQIIEKIEASQCRRRNRGHGSTRRNDCEYLDRWEPDHCLWCSP